MTKTNKKNRKKSSTKKNKIQDYYGYINNDWIHSRQLQTKKKPQISSFDILNDKINNEMKYIIINKMIKNNKNIKNLFNSFVYSDDIVVTNYIFLLIQEVNEIFKLDFHEGIYKLIGWGNEKNIQQLLSIRISEDEKDGTKNSIYIQESGIIAINEPELFTKNNKNSREFMKKYKKLLTGLFSCIFGENHEYNLQFIIDIQTEMCKYIYPPSINRTTDKIYNVFNKHNDKNISLHFEKLATHLGFKKIPTVFIVENPVFTKQSMNFMEKHWKDLSVYYIYQILLLSSNFHNKLFEIFQNYSIVDKNVKINTKEERAINLISNIMNTTVNKLYLKYYENKKEIQLTKYIVKKIVNTFVVNLKNNHWLSSETIQKALEKCDNLKVHIGTKSHWIADPTIIFSDNIFENVEKYFSWKKNFFITHFYDKTRDTTFWDRWINLNTYSVNAIYNCNKNEIVIPNGILQPPFVNVKKSIYYNLSTIGTIIGHELSHGFDNRGSLYDKYGNYNKWWKPEDYIKYSAIQNNIKAFYLETAKQDKFKISENLTLGENIADISGFQLSERTMIQELVENKIYGSEQKEYLEEFYIHFAKIWRTVIHPKLLKKLYVFDVHSYAKYRVNCTLLLSNHFRNIYHLNSNTNITIF
jgi:putative endopeptidase